jgi:hypothetical protein
MRKATYVSPLALGDIGIFIVLWLAFFGTSSTTSHFQPESRFTIWTGILYMIVLRTIFFVTLLFTMLSRLVGRRLGLRGRQKSWSKD